MTDQKRDESKDCFVVTRFGKPLRVYGIETQVIDSQDGSEDCGHYVPHSDLVAAEERADDAEYELKRLKSELRGMAANLDRQLHPDDDMMPRGKRIRLSMTGMLDHLEDLLD